LQQAVVVLRGASWREDREIEGCAYVGRGILIN
jgi:hypothetical protein